MAVMPVWIRQQLSDLAGLLSETPERSKSELRRLGVHCTLEPMVLKDGRRAYRA
jgi:hypothetical protein